MRVAGQVFLTVFWHAIISGLRCAHALPDGSRLKIQK